MISMKSDMTKKFLVKILKISSKKSVFLLKSLEKPKDFCNIKLKLSSGVYWPLLTT